MWFCFVFAKYRKWLLYRLDFMWHSFYAYIHKILLKGFKSNFPYLLWIFMWYRIICLSHLMFIIMLLIWCPMSIRSLCSLCFLLCAQVCTIFFWHFLIHSIYWKKKKKETMNLCKIEEKIRQSYHHVAELLSLFFICVTCDINDKLKTFVMCINVCGRSSDNI